MKRNVLFLSIKRHCFLSFCDPLIAFANIYYRPFRRLCQ